MISALVALALTVDPVTIKSLAVTPPADWQHTIEDGTDKWIAPSGEAFFTVDVGKTETKMSAQTCVDKITKSIGGKFDKLTVGKSPAGKKQDVDKDDSGKEFVSWTYVGCNGATTWSLVFHALGEKKADYLPVAAQVTQSIAYK